jgi:hypothetical protein
LESQEAERKEVLLGMRLTLKARFSDGGGGEYHELRDLSTVHPVVKL